MTALLLVDHDGSRLSDATLRAATAAAMLGAVHALVLGANIAGISDQAAKVRGISKVIQVDAPSLEHRLAEPVAQVLVKLADRYDTIVAPATSFGKNVLPRACALLDIAQVSDVINIIDPNTFDRPIYAGNAVQTVRCKDPKKGVTVRATSFPPAEMAGAAQIEALTFEDVMSGSRFLGAEVLKSDRPELTAAKIVVSGGRALGSAEKFREVVALLADKLGAAVGASRAAVDSGYASNDMQVGQTGKVVAPDLYIALGISGAIQHLAGMKDSKVIVAVNKDPDAPIFQVADYGLVADIFTAVPEIMAELAKS